MQGRTFGDPSTQAVCIIEAMTDLMDSSRPTLSWSPAAMFRLVIPARRVVVWLSLAVLAGGIPEGAL